MSDYSFNIIAKGKDEASKVLDGVGSAVTSIGTVALAAGAAVVAGLGMAAIAIGDMTMEAMKVDASRETFVNLTAEIGTYEGVMHTARVATRGMVDDVSLWEGANKLLGMGIAETGEELEFHMRAASQLGTAYGDNETALENWSLMMANQSIPRLDSFGISSSKVRERITELQEETEGLSREQAFNIAVQEQARVAMERVGDQGDTATAVVARMEATWANLKTGIGQKFIPVATKLFTDVLQPLIYEHGPRVVEWAGKAAEWLGNFVPKAVDTLIGIWNILKDGFVTISSIWTTALQPALMQLADALGLDTEKIGEAIGSFDGFKAVLDAVKFMVNGVIAGVQLLTIAIHKGREAVDWVKNVWWGLEQTLNNVLGRLQWVRDWIDAVATSIRNLGSLPDWLTPGSPTPLELGLRGIGNALSDLPNLSATFGIAGMAPAMAGGGSAPPIVIHNYFGRDSIRSDEDILMVADATRDALEIRGVQPAL